MHELQFARQIRAALQEAVPVLPGGRQADVYVRLSPFSHVSAEALREAFVHLIPSVGMPVKLIISTMEFAVTCRSCNTSSKSSQPVMRCPSCAATDLVVDTEREFYVERIEIMP